LQELKPKSASKSFRIRILILIILLIAASILLIFKFKFQLHDKDNNSKSLNSRNNNNGNFNINYDILKDKFERDIDSILSNFNLKKDWITTYHAGETHLNIKKDKPNSRGSDVRWFEKNIIIPIDLVSADINLDISNYLNTTGLNFTVDEDIKTANFNISVFASDDSLINSESFFKINIYHSNKIQRETGTFVIILNNIWDYKPEEAGQIINSITDFSFIYPRNFEQIDLQNNLVQSKKDVLMEINIGDKEKAEYDFFTSMNDKDIKQKVKSISTDFPGIKTSVLTCSDPAIQKSIFVSDIVNEFNKYDVKCIRDSSFTDLTPKDDANKGKINYVIERMKKLITANKLVVGIISLSYEDLNNFYNEIYKLKKAGYKFYNLSQYYTKEEEKKTKEKLKKDKENSGSKNIKEKKEKSK
jgi:hypothetical protein